MLKTEAIQLLGGTAAIAARRCRISQAAVSQWPEILTDPIVDRVQAAIARELLPPEALGIKPEALDERQRDLGPAARAKPQPVADHPHRRAYEQPQPSPAAGGEG